MNIPFSSLSWYLNLFCILHPETSVYKHGFLGALVDRNVPEMKIDNKRSITMWRTTAVRMAEQFPVKVAFFITINKAQGQTLNHGGVYLPTLVFYHRQQYIALSRATNRKNIRFLVANGKISNFKGIFTKNAVHRSVSN